MHLYKLKLPLLQCKCVWGLFGRKFKKCVLLQPEMVFTKVGMGKMGGVLHCQISLPSECVLVGEIIPVSIEVFNDTPVRTRSINLTFYKVFQQILFDILPN